LHINQIVQAVAEHDLVAPADRISFVPALMPLGLMRKIDTAGSQPSPIPQL
jgi:hypothetical protein